MKKAIIIGATSGIGEALAKELVQHDYIVGITGRREDRLIDLQQQFPDKIQYKVMDVSQISFAIKRFHQLIEMLGGVDLVVINAGIGIPNPDADWEIDRKVIVVNVLGFTAICDEATQYFIKQGAGHLVGISSIAALFGHRHSSVYSASKAYVSNFLQGIRNNIIHRKIPVTITDIKPGFVDTPLVEGQEGMFWVASSEKAALQIYQAIEKKRDHAYITRRWRLIAWLIKSIPEFILKRF